MRSIGRAPAMLLVASGKGGVGTSIIAALAAMTAASAERRVLLVDATEGSGSMQHLFNVRPARSLWMLGARNAAARDALVSIDDTLALVAGGTSAGATLPRTDVERRTALTRLASLYSEFDVVLFDGGSRLDTINAIIELADPSMLLVTSADRLALAANYALVKSIRARQSARAISVVANRHGAAVAEEACAYLIEACSHFLGRSIDVAGAIPDDPCLQAAVGAGMSVRDALSGSPAAESMRGVLTTVLPSRPNVVPAAATLVSPSFSSLPFSRRWS